MKRILALTLMATLTLSSFAFAEPDTSIGTMEKSKLSIFRIDEKKLYEKTLAENKLDAEKAQFSSKTPVEVKKPVIIKAETLPENMISQGFDSNTKDAVIGYKSDKTSKPIYENTSKVFGKSVTVTKKQLMEADYLLMQGFAMKNLRKVGTAKNGGDIMAVDTMVLQEAGGGAENTSAMTTLRMKRKGKEGEMIVNRSKDIPKFESEEILIYEAFNLRDVEVGKWHTTVIGNTLTEWKDGTIPYSTNDIEYIIINTLPYKEIEDKYNRSYFIPAPESATQLVITEW